MTTAPTTRQPIECPACNQTAKKVSTVTLGALLNDDLAGQFQTGDEACCGSSGCKAISENTGWRFCDSANCDIVYFSEKSETVFRKPQLKVQVGIKEQAGERPLCYCFGHSVASIADEFASTGKSNALDDIRAKMKDPGCRCETENPSGSCCLGSVARGLTIAQTELGMTTSDDAPNTAPTASRINRGERIAKVGTVVSAIMASSCCWLPLVLLAVGVSGAGIASTLEAYRPLFMTITFGFLGAAFYFTYRPKPSDASGGPDCCATEPVGENCCAAPARGRFNMMTMNKVMLWGVTAMAVAFLFFPGYVGAFLGGDDGNTVTEDMHKTVIRVKGMTCEGCSSLVANAICTSPEVVAVEVSYVKGEAIIGTATDAEVPGRRILTALQNAGYSGQILED